MGFSILWGFICSRSWDVYPGVRGELYTSFKAGAEIFKWHNCQWVAWWLSSKEAFNSNGLFYKFIFFIPANLLINWSWENHIVGIGSCFEYIQYIQRWIFPSSCYISRILKNTDVEEIEHYIENLVISWFHLPQYLIHCFS